MKNHTLLSLQQLLINTQLGDNPAFRDNFRSLAASLPCDPFGLKVQKAVNVCMLNPPQFQAFSREVFEKIA